MELNLDSLDRKLLDDWQRNFPVESRPFARMGDSLNCQETEVIKRLKSLQSTGRISRVGATCTPNTVSASTLAAVSAPSDSIEQIAEFINGQPGINHSYLRENKWNIWFVATGPDRKHVKNVLENIQGHAGTRVLDLPLVRAFNVDLGFKMYERDDSYNPPRPADLERFEENDREILDSLTTGLTISMQPFRKLADELDRSEDDVISRVRILQDAGIISRLGVIVRHRALGWQSNAMVVWDMPQHRIDKAGPALASFPGITLCYERLPVSNLWPYRLYCMIHAKSRSRAMEILADASRLPEVADVPREILFSRKCFKQSGAMLGRNQNSS